MSRRRPSTERPESFGAQRQWYPYNIHSGSATTIVCAKSTSGGRLHGKTRPVAILRRRVHGWCQ